MCGFIGVYSLSGELRDRDRLKRSILDCEKYIENRGPDERGFYEDRGSILLHRRLSIISLKDGKQPVSDSSAQSMVYNGEIFNYRELGEKYGLDSSRSDTDLLFDLISKRGVEVSDSLDGMFAIGYISKTALYLMRDVAGEKPLYYTQKGEEIYFSSSLQTLKTMLAPEVNQSVLVFSMMYGSLVMGEDTIYKNIKVVKPGYWIRFSRNRVTKHRYHNIRRERRFYHLSFEETKEEFLSILRSAVKKRLISDVPLGGFLSGGLDSSAITYLAKELKSDYQTFSISFGSDETGENRHAELLAKQLGHKHQSFLFDNSRLIPMLENLVKSKALPLSTPNETAINYLASQAKKSVSVVLSGEGADELLYGYGFISRGGFDYIRYQMKGYLNNLPQFQKSLLNLYGKSDFVDEQDIFQYYFRRIGYDLLLNILPPSIDIQSISEEIRDYFDTLFKNYSHLSLYERWQSIIFDINLRSLLERLDFNTMNSSLEARAPFVDREMINFSINIPMEYKLKFRSDENCFCHLNSHQFTTNYDTTKQVLRSVMDGKIPREIIDRKKYSFPVPYAQLNNEKSLMKILSDNQMIDGKIFNYKGLKRILPILRGDQSGFTTWIVKNYTDFFKG